MKLEFKRYMRNPFHVTNIIGGLTLNCIAKTLSAMLVFLYCGEFVKHSNGRKRFSRTLTCVCPLSFVENPPIVSSKFLDVSLMWIFKAEMKNSVKPI